ncbi:putative RDD family membrane protein YckC [Streptosporangium album]|uniref:Putative RDD family membrane protein YckC n=1 Tax=Streptosporangium album TaxID=47479 RepID=A0A7W7W848_9ACTN|nr:RDD family protein [Streptosporangium album]MBB4937573.1 putative RDD family membrane protein YckC [Streptosporangium album]
MGTPPPPPPPPDDRGPFPWSGPPPGQGHGGGGPPRTGLGGRWRRLFAGILDIIIVGVISSPFTYQSFTTVWDTGKDIFVRVPVQHTFLAALIGFLYYWLLTAFWNGQTLGKKLFGLRVVDRGWGRVGVGQAALRELVAWVLYATCCLGWVNLAFILFTKDKQAVHDIAAGTLVVDT